MHAPISGSPAAALLAATALAFSALAFSAPAPAAAGPLSPSPPDTITLWTSLNSAQSNGATTAIALNNDTLYTPLYSNAYQQTINGAGYTVTFNGLGSGDGAVQGASSNGAIPVAGVQGSAPTYLRGDFGSPTTTSASASGAYFTTGATGAGDGITVTFSSTIDYITLLWGSVDTTNLVTLMRNGSAVGSITGAQVQAATVGFVGNGYQGAGGSAYVELYDPNGFNSIVFSSGVNSFEFAGIAGSLGYMQIPEPAALPLLAAGLLSLGLVRRRRAA